MWLQNREETISQVQLHSIILLKDTTKVLFPDTQLKAMGVSAPEYATSDIDASGSLGGPIIKDKIWFFANARYLDNTYTSPFRPTTILGKEYKSFDLSHKEVMSFLKLTTQITPSIRFMGLFNFTDIYEPYFRLDKDWNISAEAMRVWDHERVCTGNGVLTWLLDPNTFLDVRAAYVHRWFPLPMQPGEPQNNYINIISTMLILVIDGGMLDSMRHISGRDFTLQHQLQDSRTICSALGITTRLKRVLTLSKLMGTGTGGGITL